MITNVSQKDHRLCEAKILKNALDIIYHTGLLKNEVVDLNIDDVMPNGSIVSRILPLSGSYPKGFKKKPVIISNYARKLFENHIEYLQANGFSMSPKAALFPDVKAKNRYDESKLWGFLSTHCNYHSFERHRIAGIHFLCWALSKKGHDNQQIIDTAHQFSRYSNIDRTKEIMKEGISRNPKEYENVYRSCYKAAEKIIFFSRNA